MTLLALGINHKSADVALRERLAFAPEQIEEALEDALRAAELSEVVILSTCNRTELFANTRSEDDGVEKALEWLGGYHHIPSSELKDCCYAHSGDEALRHMMQVASGLDSMVLGEPQILGQMKSAFAVAQQAGSVNSKLERVFSHVFSIAKRVRTDTAIGENPVSVAYAAVDLTRHIFSDLSETRALLVGAGETIELVARHMSEQGIKDIVVANRTLGRARELAQRFGAESVLLAEIPEQLPNVDIVIASTASQLPILGKGMVEQAMKQRKHRPILMVDIAVPRDIEEQVAELPDVYLYSVDDLKEIVEENMESRRQEARKADLIVDEGVASFAARLREQDAVSTVVDTRQKMEQIRDAELERAKRALAKGEPAEQVLERFARTLTNKFLHSPSTQLKRAGAEGRNEMISWYRELFDLDTDPQDNRE